MDALYLAAHHRDDAVGQVINQLSQAACPGPGAFGPVRHATHVYVVAKLGGTFWRLDGDLPRAKWETWRRSNDVLTDAPYAPRLWLYGGADQRGALHRLADLVDKPPPYDGLEVVQQAVAAASAMLPLPLARLLPRGLPAKDVLGRMAICTRVAMQVFGVTGLDNLFPELLTRHANANHPPFIQVNAERMLQKAWA